MSDQLFDTLSLSNLLRPEVLADPYPLYREIRSQDPVHWDDENDFWVLTRYADITSVLRDGRFSKAQGMTAGLDRLPEDEREIAEPVFGKSNLIHTLVNADGFVVVPLNSNGLKTGEAMKVTLFD